MMLSLEKEELQLQFISSEIDWQVSRLVGRQYSSLMHYSMGRALGLYFWVFQRLRNMSPEGSWFYFSRCMANVAVGCERGSLLCDQLRVKIQSPLRLLCLAWLVRGVKEPRTDLVIGMLEMSPRETSYSCWLLLLLFYLNQLRCGEWESLEGEGVCCWTERCLELTLSLLFEVSCSSSSGCVWKQLFSDRIYSSLFLLKTFTALSSFLSVFIISRCI